ncbi:MAG: hypothetical protein WBP81_13865 [Solirubrobacteraceae bacterium]
MPKTSKETASDTIAMEGFEGRYENLEGGYTVGFETYSSDADLADFFRGLPDDRCQCPHWGYVVSGKLTFTYPDREETFGAGDAYYAPPGHTPKLFAGTEIVEFRPTDGLEQTVAVVTENLRAAGVEI